MILRAPQPEGMLAFREQVHFYGNPRALQGDVVNQRVADGIDRIILGVHQKGRRRLTCNRNIRIQLKLLGPNPQMPRIKGDGEIRTAAYGPGPRASW